MFHTCELKEVDFEQCNLTQSIFDNCNLLNSKFFHSVLEKVDFRTAYNYSIDPDNNKLKKAKFSLIGLPGLLEKYNIDIS
ncbi:pentapeptide repeat-containing protein [Sphingobacterium lumbrici]|uniref:pentapeptide repeat-containing protein n=1 Tax=Sphingobacterium lumbrici TaxID=2559600 RepID=UPI0021D10F8C|nr:pentapeptide repeat-containing protein [Sphingobacterium lumbrici]